VRLNTKIPPAKGPSRLGVLEKDNQGFPNGRRLFDDVLDIELQALAGAVRTGTLVEALAAGDGVDENDVPFEEAFPYVALPHSGSGVAAGGFSGEGGLSGGASGSAEPNPSASPDEEGGVETEETDVTSRSASSESDGVSTGALIGGIALALLVGLGVGGLLARRRSSSTA
jgi:hypothetical protein